MLRSQVVIIEPDQLNEAINTLRVDAVKGNVHADMPIKTDHPEKADNSISV